VIPQQEVVLLAIRGPSGEFWNFQMFIEDSYNKEET
jgi:hypothetical protein